jgi:proteic killer suppression protein
VVSLDNCIAKRYSCPVIKSFQHSGLERFFLTGSKAGIQPAHSRKLENQLATLNLARSPADMNLPGWGLHPLQGDLTGHWSIKVNGNWRVTFRFEGPDVILVDYQDYH